MDLSLSHTEGCTSLVGLAERALQAASVPADTTLTVLVAGDTATANEPSRLGIYPIPRTRRAIEGRNANTRRQQELIQDIATKCKATRRPTISPIFIGVQQAIADLRAQGCTENSNCLLHVGSDMEENIEASIQRKLNGSNDKAVLPRPVDNSGLRILVCGLASRAGRIVGSGMETRQATPRPGHHDRVQQVWLSLFTKPELVQFAPYCPVSPSDLR